MLALAVGVQSPAGAVTQPDDTYLRLATNTNGGGDSEQVYSRTQAVTLAKRFDFAVGLRWTFEDHIGAMESANPQFRMLTYMNGTFAKPKDALSMPGSWFLRDASGNKVKSVKWGNFYMDPANPGWQAWVAQRCADWNRLSGFHGCMLDDMGSGNLISANLTARPIDPRTGKAMQTDDWIGYVTGLARKVKTANPGLLIGVNGLNNGSKFFGNNVNSKRLLAVVDVGMAEGWLRNEYASTDTFRSESAWRAEIDMLVEAGRMNKTISLQTKIWTSASTAQVDHWRRYTYASFLLGTHGQSYLNFSPEGPGKPPATHSWERVDIGSPTEQYAKRGGVYQRRYTGGIAMVNPTDSPVRVTLDKAYQRLNGTTVTSFTLGANDGEILTDVAAPSGTPPTTTVPPSTNELDSAVTFPGKGQTVSGPNLMVEGTATDDTGVASVGVAVRDRTTGRWLQSDGRTFGTKYRLLPATVANPGGAETSWSLPLTLPNGNYGIQAKAMDSAGNVDSTPPWVSFAVQASVATHVLDGLVDSPARRQVLTGPNVVMSGSATDNFGVSTVRIAIRDRVSGDWLQTDGKTFGTKYRLLSATLSDQGAVETGWTFALKLSDGAYGVQIIAEDAEGNRDSTPPWVPFEVVSN